MSVWLLAQCDDVTRAAGRITRLIRALTDRTLALCGTYCCVVCSYLDVQPPSDTVAASVIATSDTGKTTLTRADIGCWSYINMNQSRKAGIQKPIVNICWRTIIILCFLKLTYLLTYLG